MEEALQAGKSERSEQRLGYRPATSTARRPQYLPMSAQSSFKSGFRKLAAWIWHVVG